jgi:CheY-like chemotaxis protein
VGRYPGDELWPTLALAGAAQRTGRSIKAAYRRREQFGTALHIPDGDGQALLAEATRLEPDVLVLDISMPVLNGIEAARQLRGAGSRATVVFLTAHQDPDYVRGALAAGALGYVVKSRLVSDLSLVLRDALAGRSFVSPSTSLEGVRLEAGVADNRRGFRLPQPSRLLRNPGIGFDRTIRGVIRVGISHDLVAARAGLKAAADRLPDRLFNDFFPPGHSPCSRPLLSLLLLAPPPVRRTSWS